MYLIMDTKAGIHDPWMCHTSWFELQVKRFSTPCQYASATASITIKLERLTHSCVEQVFLYACGMCYTSWFELHISQDEHFDSYHLATILVCQPVRMFELFTVVPLMRDHKSHLKKRSLKRGLPYLVGNQELKPLVSLPDYPPNKANPF